MFFFFSKLLSFLISPWIWLLILLLVALWVKKTALKQKILRATLVLFLLLSNEFVFNMCVRAWEVDFTPRTQLDSGRVAVVLGGMSDYDPERHQAQFYRSSDRFLQVLPLYKSGVIKRIVFTGGSGSMLHKDRREGEYLKKYFEAMGVSTHDILIEPMSRNTRENALFTKRMLDSVGFHQPVLLVTSAFHMRRSLGCFRKVGFGNIKPLSTDFYAPEKTSYDVDRLLLPKVEVIEGWTVLIHEIVGYFTYKISGYC